VPNLALKASINCPFVGPSGPSYDPDAADWFNRVASAGGTITDDNKTAFNTAFLSLKSTLARESTATLWDHVGVGYFLMGQESFTNGLFVPFVGNGFNYTNYGPIAWNPATNFNYVSGDYNKVTGLIGDGTTKYIQVDQLPNSATGENDLWRSDMRMGYTYKNCQYTDPITKNVPFGIGNNTRQIFMRLQGASSPVGLFLAGARQNNSSGFTTMDAVLLGQQLPTGYGGVGMFSSRSIIDGGLGYFSVGGSPISQPLPSSGSGGIGPMLFGRQSTFYDKQRTACAIFGKAFESEDQNSGANDFKSLNTIMETLRTSLI
jgi:hypothetical protein